ncbi:hypothetical protein RG47T_2406 [Mucilaginibacter polytrichastri]|uniref:Uncharacterized protein n=1 Tax=Mucilaginibacter polytrichastri TaxID=1302689 RepID=A0A1Q5ZYX9_9SPHI|nr:hypothetical protein RG47T_2406 [Mucilaginibacter polytrichastri]
MKIKIAGDIAGTDKLLCFKTNIKFGTKHIPAFTVVSQH